MKKIVILFTVIFFAGSIFAQRDLTTGTLEQKRLALVIGNSNYQHGGTLRNPVNDANLLQTTLEDLGFTVIKKTDATLRDMQVATADFTKKIKDYDVALFFYAGHGIQVDGENYLIPVDAKLEDRTMAKFDAFNISFVNDAFMQNSENINIMILDACRNDPFRSWGRGGERGFAKIDNPASGTIIAFATQPGATASDGSGNNGLYTSHLVKQMEKEQDIEDVFKNTRIAVNNASNGAQVPQDWSSLMGDFYFTTVTDANKNNNNNTTPVVTNETNNSNNQTSNSGFGTVNIYQKSNYTINIEINNEFVGTINKNSTFIYNFKNKGINNITFYQVYGIKLNKTKQISNISINATENKQYYIEIKASYPTPIIIKQIPFDDIHPNFKHLFNN